MNFLEIVQRARRKCRIVGVGATPTAVTGQNEEYSRLIDWCNEAWMEIQLHQPDWYWMRRRLLFPTVDGQPLYTLADLALNGVVYDAQGAASPFTAATFGNWAPDQFRCNTTATGFADEQMMDWIPNFDAWRDSYLLGNMRETRTRPTVYTIGPGLSVGLGFTPLAGYTIGGSFYLKASEMVLATDIPALPTEWHMAIVYKTMMLYGASESAPEVYDDGENWYRDFLSRMLNQQLPMVETAPALA